ncbi:MAG: aryl-sulfate sulfotransferase [Myxococcota bacterium]|nr:aryl-sulfate sulfotransferase [Myxococcota bacterium]
MLLPAMLFSCQARLDGLEAGPLEAVVTVIEVTWRAKDEDETAWVEYSTAGGPVLLAPEIGGEDGEHRVLIIGHPEATVVDLQPVVERGGQRVEGEMLAVETGALPPGLSDYEVSVSAAGQSEATHWMGMLLQSSEFGYDGTPIIIDRAGRIVWYHTLNEGSSAIQLERQLGTNDVLINLLNLKPEQGEEPTALLRIAMDGERVSALPAEHSHHAFAQPEPGVVAYLAYDERTVDEYDATVVGDLLIETDAHGEETVLFSTWDALDVSPEEVADSDEERLDWTHANGLFYWAEHDSYLMSLHNLSLVLEISRATGEVMATIGEGGDFTFPDGPEAIFYQQHHPTVTAEGTLMLFDNHTLGGQGMSRAVEYVLDDAQKTATLVWEDPLDNDYTVGGLGQSHRLSNGNTLINWGVLGELSEVTAEGELVWQVNTPLGETFGSGLLIDDLYAGLR